MRTVQCSCGRKMAFLKREKIQLGQTGFFAGDWPNIMAGALEVEIYCCPKCGKIEFYRPEDMVEEPEDEENLEISELPPESSQNIVGVSRDGVPQVRCPKCGKTHDFDYPQCPYCGNQAENNEKSSVWFCSYGGFLLENGYCAMKGLSKV